MSPPLSEVSPQEQTHIYNNKYTTFLSNKKINFKLSTKKHCIFATVITNTTLYVLFDILFQKLLKIIPQQILHELHIS